MQEVWWTHSWLFHPMLVNWLSTASALPPVLNEWVIMTHTQQNFTFIPIFRNWYSSLSTIYSCIYINLSLEYDIACKYKVLLACSFAYASTMLIFSTKQLGCLHKCCFLWTCKWSCESWKPLSLTLELIIYKPILQNKMQYLPDGGITVFANILHTHLLGELVLYQQYVNAHAWTDIQCKWVLEFFFQALDLFCNSTLKMRNAVSLKR